MASADLSRRVEKVVAYPPLSEMDELQRREFREALLDAATFEDLAVTVIGGVTHDRHDLVHRRRVGRVAHSLVARWASGVVAGQRRCCPCDGALRPRVAFCASGSIADCCVPEKSALRACAVRLRQRPPKSPGTGTVERARGLVEEGRAQAPQPTVSPVLSVRQNVTLGCEVTPALPSLARCPAAPAP